MVFHCKFSNKEELLFYKFPSTHRKLSPYFLLYVLRLSLFVQLYMLFLFSYIIHQTSFVHYFSSFSSSLLHYISSYIHFLDNFLHFLDLHYPLNYLQSSKYDRPHIHMHADILPQNVDLLPKYNIHHLYQKYRCQSAPHILLHQQISLSIRTIFHL